MLDKSILTDSIAYCGLICNLCFLSSKCAGCKTLKSNCFEDMSEKSCFQKDCCVLKKYEGCWECPDLKKCKEGIFIENEYSKVKAFSLYIQKNNKSIFIDAIIKNIKNGLNIEKGQDLDNLKIKAIHDILNQKD